MSYLHDVPDQSTFIRSLFWLYLSCICFCNYKVIKIACSTLSFLILHSVSSNLQEISTPYICPLICHTRNLGALPLCAYSQQLPLLFASRRHKIQFIPYSLYPCVFHFSSSTTALVLFHMAHSLHPLRIEKAVLSPSVCSCWRVSCCNWKVVM